jgi:hypothetical protein
MDGDVVDINISIVADLELIFYHIAGANWPSGVSTLGNIKRGIVFD